MCFRSSLAASVFVCGIVSCLFRFSVIVVVGVVVLLVVLVLLVLCRFFVFGLGPFVVSRASVFFSCLWPVVFDFGLL